MAEHFIFIIIYYDNDSRVLYSVSVSVYFVFLFCSFPPLLHCISITEEKGKLRNEVGKKLKAFSISKINMEMKSRTLEN